MNQLVVYFHRKVMQDGWFVVSKNLINKFDLYIVNFNKLISLCRRDTKFERCFPAMTRDITLLKYSAQNR